MTTIPASSASLSGTATDAAGIVACALIWLDYLRRREKGLNIKRLLLYVPVGREGEVACRAGLIDQAAVQCHLYACDEKDRVGAVRVQTAVGFVGYVDIQKRDAGIEFELVKPGNRGLGRPFLGRHSFLV